MSLILFVRRRVALTVLVVTSTATISCTDSTGLPPSRTNSDQLAPGPDLLDQFMQSRALDRDFWRIAHSVPGFGGAYLDSDGTPVVVLVDTTLLTAATSALRAILVTPKDATLNRTTRAALGKFDFIVLATWLFQATPLHGIDGVVGLGIDERRNRLIVGFSDDRAVPEIYATLSRLGVPTDGVILEHRAPIMFTSLSSMIRPVANGYAMTGAGQFAACTIGLNASQNGTGAAYAVVPGHCTRVIGAVDGTEFFQPDAATAPNRIGVEIADVNYFAGDNLNGCSSQRFCTYADAALMKYDHDGDRDPMLSIPVTDFRSGPGQGPGSTNVSWTSQIYAVEGYDILPAMQGWTLDRIGPNSGWTYGQVLNKCFDVDIGGTSLTLLCQTEVSGLQEIGDSGSQVFSTQTQTSYYLYGMATSAESDNSSFFYNPMSTIMDKLNTNSYPLMFCGC